MPDFDPDAYADAYAKVYRRHRLQSLCGRIVGYLFLVCVLILVFCPEPMRLISVNWGSNARRASCASNLKQLSVAMTQYEQDYDGKLPAYQKSAGGTGWREAVYPYVKASGVYQCPEDKRQGNYTPDHLPRSYAANDSQTGQPLTLTTPIPGGTGVVNSGQVIRIIDTRGYDGAGWDITDPAFLPGTGRELYAHVPRHLFYEHPGGVINCLFSDGHVKRLKPMATLMPVNLWTRDNATFTGQELQNAQAILKHAEDE